VTTQTKTANIDTPPEPDDGSRLRPRARLLRTLGQELISNEVAAVIELVKNAYDADATRVLVQFASPLEIGKGKIEVLDNGHGMPLEIVRTVWMEPATPSKREQRRSKNFKRRYLGEKGIGRFATSRLANELEVVSRGEGDSKEVYAVFDWTQFDIEEKYLDQVIVLWDQRPPLEISAEGTIRALWKSAKKPPTKRDLSHGTILRMAGLRQAWEAKQFEDLRRGLARLISPRLEKEQEFNVELELPPEYSEFSTAIQPPPILNYPHYTVSGKIDRDGSYKLTYKIIAEGKEYEFSGKFLRTKVSKDRWEAQDLVELENQDDSRPLECGPLEIELRVWDRDELGNVLQKVHSTVQDIRRDLDAMAGINIYRDNFRVLPYGEPQNDWLRLDIRRVQNPTLRLSNNQIFGVVHISADGNPKLKDQSNREGLDENQALRDLRLVMIAILAKLEQERYKARPRAKGKQKPIGGIFSRFNLQPLTDFVARRLPEDKEAKRLVRSTEAAFSTHLKEIQTVLARYQRLATLGQLVDHVLHEGRQPIAGIVNEAQLGLGDVEKSGGDNGDNEAKFSQRFMTIRRLGGVLATAFKRMEPFSGRQRGRPVQLYVEDVIRDAFEIFATDLKRLEVKATLPESQTLVRVDAAEIEEIIVNLLTNSLHWLEQISRRKREIFVSVQRKQSEEVEILFCDNGPGIPSEDRSFIFDAYFSTKPEGIGLGLSIAGEIVTDYYGGSLELLKSGPLRGANFLITLRKRL
jgi:signal transduction histidine kinase